MTGLVAAATLSVLVTPLVACIGRFVECSNLTELEAMLSASESLWGQLTHSVKSMRPGLVDAVACPPVFRSSCVALTTAMSTATSQLGLWHTIHIAPMRHRA